VSATRIALATSRKYADLPPDERALIPALAARGVEGIPVVWDDASVAWDSFAAVIVRSCWDYHLRLGEFLGWIGALEQRGIAVHNPPAVLRWNAKKTYLRELAARGYRVAPTRFAAGPAVPSLSETLHAAGWDKAVVKPVVSASSYQTWVTTAAQAAGDEERYRELARHGGALVQPFINAIVREGGGEWSFCFFDGRFSHAALKQPVAGEFRVQVEFGGRILPRSVAPALVEQAARIAAAAPARCLYARVDGYVVDDAFHLMELEVLEPSMLLGCDPAAPDRFAAAIIGILGSP
jgi:glutathione synthase/RimK-type ligase-like ATP-grasp enzyme